MKDNYLNYFYDSISDLDAFSTPCFIYSEKRLTDNIKMFSDSVRSVFPNGKTYYGTKSCYIRRVLETIANHVQGFDVQSSLEYSYVKRIHVNTDSIIYNSPCKTKNTIEEIVSNSGLVIADTVDEIKEIADHRKRLGIRLCTYNDSYDSDRFFINKTDRFGVSIRDVDVHSLISRYSLDELVFHMHYLSRNENAANIFSAYQKNIHELSKWQCPISIDFGGGFNSRTRLENAGVNLHQLMVSYRKLTCEIPELNCVYFEPGRYITEDAAIAITTITNIKQVNGVNWIIVDIATNILVPVKAASFEVTDVFGKSGEGDEYCIGDATCSPAGVIQRNVKLKNVKPGDKLIIKMCGAYTYSLAETFCQKIPPLYFRTLNNYESCFTQTAANQVADLMFDGGIE